RDWDYEHHAGDGHRAHSGNRDPKGYWGGAPRDHVPVSDGSVLDQWGRCGAGDFDRVARAGDRSILSSRKLKGSGVVDECTVGVCGFLLDRTVFWIFAG